MKFSFCYGIDAGIDTTLYAMEKATPDLYAEFCEVVNFPKVFFRR